MKRLLIEPLIWLVLGASLSFGMNHYGVHVLDDHPSTNWFLVGLGLLILGGFRCSPSDTGRSFANLYASTGRQRLGGVQEEDQRLSKALPEGLLMMACGAILLGVAALFL
jgi:hypothetical protein